MNPMGGYGGGSYNIEFTKVTLRLDLDVIDLSFDLPGCDLSTSLVTPTNVVTRHWKTVQTDTDQGT